jgi:hypothetical protein
LDQAKRQVLRRLGCFGAAVAGAKPLGLTAKTAEKLDSNKTAKAPPAQVFEVVRWHITSFRAAVYMGGAA